MASNAPLPPIPANIAFLTGPPLLGIMFNWSLLGILVVQVYIYRLCFQDDRRTLKILVYGLFFIEFVQTMLTTADGFHWFAFGFGNIVTLATTFISPVDAPIINSTIAFAVQLFFCWRLWILSKSRVLCGLISIIAGVQLGGGWAAGILALKSDSVSPEVLPPLATWLAGSALVDTLIAASMTIFLLRAKRNKNTDTNDIVVRIVRLTVETNTISAGVAIITLGLFIAFPRSNISFCPSYALGKIYTNTMMVSLNNRILLSRRGPALVTSGINFKLTETPDETLGESLSTSSNVKRHQKSATHRGMLITTDIQLDDLDASQTARSFSAVETNA